MQASDERKKITRLEWSLGLVVRTITVIGASVDRNCQCNLVIPVQGTSSNCTTAAGRYKFPIQSYNSIMPADRQVASCNSKEYQNYVSEARAFIETCLQ